MSPIDEYMDICANLSAQLENMTQAHARVNETNKVLLGRIDRSLEHLDAVHDGVVTPTIRILKGDK